MTYCVGGGGEDAVAYTAAVVDTLVVVTGHIGILLVKEGMKVYIPEAGYNAKVGLRKYLIAERRHIVAAVGVVEQHK